MAFIIMNLLVGLTVNKIEELLKTGEKIQAIKRVEDISGMAKIIKKVEKCFKKCFGNHGWMLKRIMKSFHEEKPKKVGAGIISYKCMFVKEQSV
jgi:hypothetical protein